MTTDPTISKDGIDRRSARIKSALVAWGWLPGWLHVKWKRETTEELLNRHFRPLSGAGHDQSSHD